MSVRNLVKQGNKVLAKFKALTKAPDTIKLDEHEYYLIDEVQCVGSTNATYIKDFIRIDKRSFRKGKSYQTKNNNYINPNL
jgi:hypothetical protein